MGDSSKGGYADNSTVENRAKAAWNARPEYHESLRRDAERYRWLRQYTIKSLPVAGALDSLDRQIDAAMAKEAE
jgi:transposase